MASDDDDTQDQLVFIDGGLIAVLVHLSEVHDDEAGMCFLEFGFGRASVPNSLKFRSLDAAQDWIAGRLTRPQS